MEIGDGHRHSREKPDHLRESGLAVLREQADILQGSTTRLLAASLKSVEEVQGALLSGAHDVTVPLNVLEALGDHPLSDLAIRDFAAVLRTER